ncbi:MAG: hypothetical protein R2860_00490 [Desulfobacterales bacterium]
MKIQRCRMLGIFFLLSFVLCGCSAKNAPHQAVEYYALNYTPLPTEARPMLPVALSIENFRSSPPFIPSGLFTAGMMSPKTDIFITSG